MVHSERGRERVCVCVGGGGGGHVRVSRIPLDCEDW